MNNTDPNNTMNNTDPNNTVNNTDPNNKMVNIQCGTCRKRFDNTVKLQACVCMSCEHLVHDIQNVVKHLSKDDLVESDQRYIDISSVTRNKQEFSHWRKFIGYVKVARTLPMIGGLSIRMALDHSGLPLLCSENRKWINMKFLQRLNMKVINLLNINIDVIGKDKLTNDSTKCIVICNHSNYHDMFIGATVSDKMGFMASPAINNFTFGRAITRVYPHVMVENDTTSRILEKDKKKYTDIDNQEKKGGFQKMKEFLDSDDPLHNKLMVCPEGMLSSAHSMVKFRTSAFKCGYPVRPIVLKYKQNIFDLVGFDIMCNKQIDVEVIIMDLMETDGSNESIEHIRQEMAKVGGLTLSRVENRSLPKN
jgi:1-acyl-sn-glycerol-3-phosphate acyltransferase